MVSITAPGDNYGPGVVKGIKARFAQANQRGEVDGYTLKLEVADTQLDPAKAPAAMRTLVESKKVIATLGSISSEAAAVAPYLESKQMLTIPTGNATALIASDTSPFRFALPLIDELMARDIDYAVNTLGLTKIGIASTPDVIGDAVLTGARKELKRLGLKEVAAVEYSSTATNADTQAAKLKAAGAEFVVLNHVAPVISLLIKSADKIGFKPVYGATYAAANPALPEIVGRGVLDDRIYFATSLVMPDSPEATDYRTFVEKQGGDPSNGNTLAGWTVADAMVATLTAAAKSSGSKALTPAQVLKAATDLSVDDAYVPDLTWSDKDRTGPDQSRIVKLTNGNRFVEVDPLKPNPK